MRLLWRRALSVAAALLLLTPAGLAGRETDVVLGLDELLAKYPSQVELLFENEYVWVTRVTLEPGQGLPTHESGKRVIYPLTGYELLYIPNYEPERMGAREGNVHWHQNEAHAVVNRGKTTARYLSVIRKPTPLPKPGATVCCEVADKTPFSARVLFDNNEARVIEIRLQRGESQPEHYATNRAIYSLSSYELRMGEMTERFDPGDVHWHGPSEHAVENIGQAEAWYLVFEMKR